jgi:nitrite reductase/ring-hydroxylating ferredoxin subunit
MSSRDKKSWDASPDMPAGHFVSGDVYTDPDIYKDESEKVFAKAWRFACHDSELPEAFDYRVFEQDGQSLFAIRGEDGVIRSFLNVCSHRGAKLLDQPAGNAKLITCFYHRWTYDAHGHCAGIPRVSGYSGDVVSKETMGLREVRTETLHGLVFVTLDDAAPDLTSFVGKALDRFSEMLTGQPLEVFHYAGVHLMLRIIANIHCMSANILGASTSAFSYPTPRVLLYSPSLYFMINLQISIGALFDCTIFLNFPAFIFAAIDSRPIFASFQHSRVGACMIIFFFLASFQSFLTTSTALKPSSPPSF